MALAEDVIFTDPVLQRVFLDRRNFAPKHNHEAIVNIMLYGITLLKQSFQKAHDLQTAEQVQRLIRCCWFDLRRHCDGYFIELPAGHDDGCQHVAAFEHDATDGAFLPDFRARAALWHRLKQRPPPAWYYYP